MALPKETSPYRLKGLVFFVPFSLAVLGLGIWGFMSAPDESACRAANLGEATLHALMLVARSGGGCAPGVRLPLQLSVAQVVLPLLLALGTVFAAVKIILVNLRHDARLALVQAMRGHTIICGLGETGLEATRQLVLQHGKVAVITLDAAADAARYCEALGVPLIIGDATLRRTLTAAGIARARAFIICTGSDALNLEICLAIGGVSRRARHDLLLFPEIRGGWVLKALTERQTRVVGEGVQLHPFQAEEIIARTLLKRPAFVPLGAPPRLLFIGFGSFAGAILRRAILGNYALPGWRVQAHGVDAQPLDRQAESWTSFAEVTGAVHEFGRDQADDERVIGDSLDQHRPDIVIVTLANDAASLRAATLVRGALDKRACFETALFVRVQKETRLCALLSEMAVLPMCPDRFTGFGDLGEVVAPNALFDERLDVLARAVHESYLANSSGASPARVPWAALAEYYRRSSRAAADHVAAKLAAAGYVLRQGAGPSAAFDEAAIEAMAAAEHHRWSLALQVAGWRVGPERNEFLKTHPLLVPWAALPDAVRADNRRQIATLPDCLARAGLRALRLVPARGGEDLAATDLAVFELDATAEAGWQEAETVLQSAEALVTLASPGVVAAALLRARAERFPRAARAVIKWRVARP
jgi:voltage-gated potassium channel Kch